MFPQDVLRQAIKLIRAGGMAKDVTDMARYRGELWGKTGSGHALSNL